jgi:hypothetical protein
MSIAPCMVHHALTTTRAASTCILLCLTLQWNIERGYELAAVIAELEACDADIIALQEVDIGCDRSGGEDTGKPGPVGGRTLDTLQPIGDPTFQDNQTRQLTTSIRRGSR